MHTVKDLIGKSHDQTMASTATTCAWVGSRAWTRGTVLVIERDKLIRNWLRWVLHSRGYDVVTAATTDDAEAAMYQLGARHVDLVMIDVHLQSEVMAGYHIYQRWTRAYPTMPFLLMSDEAHDHRLVTGQGSSVRFLVKRFVIAELMEAVRSLCRQTSPERQASPKVALTASSVVSGVCGDGTLVGSRCLA